MVKSGAEVNHRNRYGENAVHDAAKIRDLSPASKQKSIDAIAYFIALGGDIDIEDGDGFSVRRMIINTLSLVPGFSVFLAEDDLDRGDLARTSAAVGTIPKQAKIGRNDPCRCGSKKKFKACCGKA